MTKLKLLFVSLFLAAGLVSGSSIAFAADPAIDPNATAAVCEGIGLVGSASGCVEESGGLSVGNLIGTIIRLLSYLVGIIAVIMIIIGSVKFMTSAGDAGKIKSAKGTIMYALIGLVIAALAQVIIRFTLNKATTDKPIPMDPAGPTGALPVPQHTAYYKNPLV